jgi:hypothetical protein
MNLQKHNPAKEARKQSINGENLNPKPNSKPFLILY